MVTFIKINNRPTGRVTKVWRGPVSPMGNPSWFVALGERVYRTSANASVSYEIGDHFVGRLVSLDLTRANRITAIETLATRKDECYVCNGQEHATGSHAYWPTSEARAEFARQPSHMWAPHADESLRFPGED